MLKEYLSESRSTINRLADNPELLHSFEEIAETLWQALKGGNKILLAGNGGSAADCQHIAGELVVRFREDRPGLSAIALTVDTSVLTACINDWSAEWLFSRQVEALGRAGDILWAFSTSGNSENILRACEKAKLRGMPVLGFGGGDGGTLRKLCDYFFCAPSAVTSHIQECHIIVGHMLCHYIERKCIDNSRQNV